jgi:hypothetical protein
LNAQGFLPDSTGNAPSGYDISKAPAVAYAVVDYIAPTAQDDFAATVAVTCDPHPHSSFPAGSTLVSCTADDGSNRVINSFNVVVQTPAVPTFTPVPELTSLGVLRKEADSAPLTTVYYTLPVAQDAFGTSLTGVSCDHGPNTGFPLGDTLVLCSVRDAGDQVRHYCACLLLGRNCLYEESQAPDRPSVPCSVVPDCVPAAELELPIHGDHLRWDLA